MYNVLDRPIARGGSRIFLGRGCTISLRNGLADWWEVFFLPEYKLYQKAAGHLRRDGGRRGGGGSKEALRH